MPLRYAIVLLKIIMQAETKFVLHHNTGAEKLKNRLTPKYHVSQVQTQPNTETGMVFPQTILVQIKCDKKSQYSEVLSHNFQAKLTSQGFSGVPITSIFKVKLYSNKVRGKVTLKLQTQLLQHYFHIQPQDITLLFTKLLWLRLATMNIFADFEPPSSQIQITDDVIKKSEFFGKWQSKRIKLSGKGLQIYGDGRDKLQTKVQSFSQFWTRFEMIDNKSYLVVKLMVGMFKYQLGIHIGQKITWWMKGFCSLLKKP